MYTPPGTDQCLEYENMSHVFGNRGSLTNAVTTVKLAALKFEKEHPLAAEVILRGSLVHDNLGSVMTVEEGAAVVQGLQKIYGSVGMHIHKWSASHSGTLAGLNPADLSPSVSFSDTAEDEHLGVTKALGIVWDTKSDVLSYLYQEPSVGISTQRNLLKLYMAIFAPLGWVGPFVILARMLYRDTCSLKLGWDTDVPECLSKNGPSGSNNFQSSVV